MDKKVNKQESGVRDGVASRGSESSQQPLSGNAPWLVSPLVSRAPCQTWGHPTGQTCPCPGGAQGILWPSEAGHVCPSRAQLCSLEKQTQSASHGPEKRAVCGYFKSS